MCSGLQAIAPVLARGRRDGIAEPPQKVHVAAHRPLGHIEAYGEFRTAPEPVGLEQREQRERALGGSAGIPSVCRVSRTDSVRNGFNGHVDRSPHRAHRHVTESTNAVSNPHDFPEPSMITVNGIELEIFETSQENASKPIVLCHGWPELAFSWRDQMDALAAAGYHVIAPNQRGYGNASRPAEVTDYDIVHLSGDLVGLLVHFGYEDATFVGHDRGANVVWSTAVLHPTRVNKVIALSVPYMERGEVLPLTFIEAIVGSDSYFVHFNRQPGVADAVFAANARQFLRNLYRKNEPPAEPEPGMPLINPSTPRHHAASQ